MGLFDKIFKKPNVDAARNYSEYFKTLTAYKPHFKSWNGKLYESELVRAAIDARARNISKLKVELTGTANPRLQNRLKLRPNPWMTWPQFLYRTSTILDMHNTAAIVPVYDDNMTIVGYYPVLPEKCEVVEYQGEPWLRYTFKDRQKAAERLSLCAVLTKFQYSSDFFGEPNNALNSTMEMDTLDKQGIAEAVKNGATYRFMARMNNFSKTEDLKEERERFTEANFKSEEANGGILLFPNTYTDIRQIDTTAYTVPKEEREEIRTNVYNYFAVNQDILQSKAYGDAWAAFYESAIEPFAIQFSEAMTFAAFSENEISRGTQIMLTANRLQYLTTSEKLNVTTQLPDRGIMSRNEAREVWNMSPIEGGDSYTIRGEYYLIDETGAFTRAGTEGEENAN